MANEPGNYNGSYQACELVSSAAKGTPGIRLWFIVADGEQIGVDVWITESSADIAIKQLKAAGWNGDYDKPEFSAEIVPLYMKHEVWKGETRERWSISTFEKRDPPKATDDALKRFAARFKAESGAKPPPPPGAAKPAPTAPKASAPPKPPAAPKKPAPKVLANDMPSAWACWAEHGNTSEEEFWGVVLAITGTVDGANATADQWNEVARKVAPF